MQWRGSFLAPSSQTAIAIVPPATPGPLNSVPVPILNCGPLDYQSGT